jgi:hypothetical protein
MDSYYPGGRMYVSRTFTRATGETDPLTGSTATVTLADPEGTEVTVDPTETVGGGNAEVTGVFEYTIPDDAVPGVWTEAWDWSNVLVDAREFQFRVLRRRTTVP